MEHYGVTFTVTLKMYRYAFVKVLLFAVVAITLYQPSAGNYCAQALCNGAKHIGCKNSGKFVKSCPAGAKMVNIPASLRKVIVKAHNTRRNMVAGGKVSKLPSACRMATMQWDAELAKLAALNVRQCTMQHDECRNTNKFRFAGQNLAFLSSTKSNPNNAKNFQTAVDLWYKEVSVVKLAHIKSYPRSYNGPAIGHFTVMVAEKNTRVGCAAAIYKKGKFFDYLIACNYAATNVIGKPIYTGCSKPAAKCKKGVNSAFKNLCSPKEVYAVNSY